MLMLVIKGGTIYTGLEVLKDKDILVEKGKIQKIGARLAVPKEAQVIDAKNHIIWPGIVDAHSHVGGFGSDMEDQDLNEMTQNATPQMASIYAINTDSKDFKRILKSGITTSGIAPGSGNVVGGVVCAVKSYGKGIDDMCIKNPIALKMALGGNPKGVYGKRNQMPMTRMGIAHVIRETLLKGQDYMNKKKLGKKDPDKMPPYDEGLENVEKALKREIPLKVHGEQFDMLTILRIAEEFNVEVTLDHAWGASDFYDDIAGSKNCRGVIYGPIGVLLLPGECGKIDIQSVIELDKRGVCCAIMTDGPILNPDTLMIQAGEVMRFGGEEQKVVQMLTLNPAKIMGVEDRIGSIEKGKDGDMVIFDQNPLEKTNAQVLYTIVNGEIAYQKE